MQIKSLFKNKRTAKFVSLFIAVIAWFLVAIFISPETDAVIRDIPINASLEEAARALGLSIVEGGDQTVSITVRGKRHIVGSLSAGHFDAVVSTAGVTSEGTHFLDCIITAKKPDPNNYVIENDRQPNIRLVFARLITRQFEPIISDMITPEEGYMKLQLVSPGTINIEGTQTDLDMIHKVVVSSPIEQTGVTGNIQLDGEIELYDENETKLDNSRYIFENQRITITVAIFLEKTVPFYIEFINIPEGVDTDELNIKLTQSEIKIGVSSGAAPNINRILLGRIDFRKLEPGVPFTFEVLLPTGCINIEGIEEVTALFEGEGYDTKTVDVTNFSVLNRPDNLNVSVTTKVLRVRVTGRAELLEQLTARDFVAEIDLKDQTISPGSTSVRANILLTAQGFVWAVGEYEVTISAANG